MQIVEIETIGRHAADFRPRRFLNNGHLQTIAGNYLARINELPAPEVQLVEVSPATANQIASQVLCHCHWQPEEVRAARPTANGPCLATSRWRFTPGTYSITR